jgi:hypothetical protein
MDLTSFIDWILFKYWHVAMQLNIIIKAGPELVNDQEQLQMST